MIKVRKSSRIKVWKIFACNGEMLGEFSFYTEEVKACFPGAVIKAQKVYLG